MRRDRNCGKHTQLRGVTIVPLTSKGQYPNGFCAHFGRLAARQISVFQITVIRLQSFNEHLVLILSNIACTMFLREDLLIFPLQRCFQRHPIAYTISSQDRS